MWLRREPASARANSSSSVDSHVSLWKLVECSTISVCAAAGSAPPFASDSGVQYRFAVTNSGYSADGGMVYASTSMMPVAGGNRTVRHRGVYMLTCNVVWQRSCEFEANFITEIEFSPIILSTFDFCCHLISRGRVSFDSAQGSPYSCLHRG